MRLDRSGRAVLFHDDCPNCRSSGMEVFYEAQRIPVHSCVMLNNRENALAFPVRDLALGLCRRCAFISNVLFDGSVQEYSAGYEEQQSYSPTFRAFQSTLVHSLIERYDLRDKNIVEIGCGKGDFLVELCETGANRGVGIDPACDPQRVAERGDGRVRFIAELYSKQHADLPCDCLCCRHTLEHIQRTNEFVRVMREVVGSRSGAIVVMEVPAIERVLGEGAFWDIYYEHCSYFSLGSLARVFRANCFEIIELCADYDDQYLILVARPTDHATAASLSIEDDLEVVTEGVAAFRERVRTTIDGWRCRIQRLRSEGKRLAVWGSGSKCVSFLCAVDPAGEMDTIVDINPFRQGKWLAGVGKQVLAPDSLRMKRPDVVLAMNAIYRDEIQRHLDSMGVEAELLCV